MRILVTIIFLASFFWSAITYANNVNNTENNYPAIDLLVKTCIKNYYESQKRLGYLEDTEQAKAYCAEFEEQLHADIKDWNADFYKKTKHRKMTANIFTIMVIGLIFCLLHLYTKHYETKQETDEKAKRQKTEERNKEQERQRQHEQQKRRQKEQQRQQYRRQSQSQSELDKAFSFFGLSRNSTVSEFRKRYKELAQKYHPDKPGGSKAKMQELNKFKEVLNRHFGVN